MKLALVAPYDPGAIANNWGVGATHFMGNEFQRQGDDVEFVGPLEQSFKKLFGFKWLYYKYFQDKQYHLHRIPFLAQRMASDAARKIATTQAEIIFGPLTTPFAYLDCKQPIVFWTDSTFANLLGSYFKNSCQESIRNGHLIDRLALDRCSLAIYTSEWAAKSAIEDYGADPNKIKVVPFGANINCTRTMEDIEALVQAKPKHQCNLLFLGRDWVRKGGDIAVKVAAQLNQTGLKTRLTVIGCDPVTDSPLPDFVKSFGCITRATPGGQKLIERALSEAHFLILPSRAECFGVVFCEAASFGVPSISTAIGGIPSAIRSGISGQLFDLDADISEYCRYISDLFLDFTAYRSLALSAFHEYELRLNWSASIKQVRQLTTTLL